MNLSRWFSPQRLPELLAGLLLLVAVIRIASTYHVLSQAYDEPATVAGGMEWLDRGTYLIDPFHPPLARVASVLGPYLAGARMADDRMLMDERGVSYDMFGMGTEILNWSGRYWQTLTLARLGMLPFLVLGTLVVFWWAREVGGGETAVLAVLCFTTLPPILAFSGFAYTDMPVAVLVGASAFVFARWLESPSPGRAALFGGVTALAVLANFPAILFLPPCWLVTLACWWWFHRRKPLATRELLGHAALAVLLGVVILWAGYRFDVERLNHVYARPSEDVRALHASPRVKAVLQEVVAINPPIPAPALVRGLTSIFKSNTKGRPSYLFGEVREGGWRYFFLVVAAVKSPVAFLILAGVGGASMLARGRKSRDWRLLVPCLCGLSVLAASTLAKVNYGRSVLSVYPFLAVLAGYGGMFLWTMEKSWLWPGRIGLAILLAWLLVSTTWIHPDYVAYFNELAGRHPEKVLLWGCDYDCGQDAARLGKLLRERNVHEVSLSLFTTSDVTKLGYPPFRVLNPYERTTGWVAASMRLILTGDTFWGGTHPDAYRWLLGCQPVARAGKTIYLYSLPCNAPVKASSNGTLENPQ
jgi:hypothetical protein